MGKHDTVLLQRILSRFASSIDDGPQRAEQPRYQLIVILSPQTIGDQLAVRLSTQ